MTITTDQLVARAKFWREKAVEAKWESVSIAQDMLLNADAFEELAYARYLLAAREAVPVAWTDEDELSDARKGYSGYLFAIDGEANKFADPRRKIMLYTAPPAPEPSPSATDDLIMQVRRLVHALKKANPDHALVKQVPDYMRRAGYWKLTDCLRGAAAAPEDASNE